MAKAKTVKAENIEIKKSPVRGIEEFPENAQDRIVIAGKWSTASLKIDMYDLTLTGTIKGADDKSYYVYGAIEEQ